MTLGYDRTEQRPRRFIWDGRGWTLEPVPARLTGAPIGKGKGRGVTKPRLRRRR